MPLALAQAGAYIRQTNITVHEYLEYYDSTWEDLIEEQDSYPLLEYAQRSMLTTWTISYQQVERQNVGAAKLLKLWAYFDPKDVWYELLACAIDLQSQIEIPEWLSTLVKSRLKFRSAFGLLKKYSLVNDETDTASYSMHAVLHSWCRHISSMSSIGESLPELAVSIVAQMVPEEHDESCWVLSRRLLPHGQQLLSYLRLGTAWKLSHIPAGVYEKSAKLFEHNKAYEETAELLQRAIEEKERYLGQDDVSTLDAFRKLARIYYKMNRNEDPMLERFYERSLAGCEKALGLDPTNSTDVSERMSKILLACEQPSDGIRKTLLDLFWVLSMVCFGQERFAKAEMVFQLTLAESQNLYYEHEGRVTALSKQSSKVYNAIDRLTDGKEMASRTAAAYDETVAMKYNLTLEDMLRQGKHAEAEVEVEAEAEAEAEIKVNRLAEVEKVFAAEHISALRADYQLAMSYAGQANKLQEATTLYEQMIPRFTEIFGLDNDATQSVIQTLGILYRDKLGMLSEAEELFKQNLGTSERLCGSGHTETLVAFQNLAHVYRLQGDKTREVEMRRRLLVACENTFGVEHQQTVDAALYLGVALRRSHGFFSLSSRNIKLDGDYNLVASCGGGDGSWNQSTISLNDILENVCGQFSWGGNGNFVATARNIKLRCNGRLLVADLGDGYGGWNHATVRLDENIENSRGKLRFWK
jgi:tetratricopeptide (TPR) repeat protein